MLNVSGLFKNYLKGGRKNVDIITKIEVSDGDNWLTFGDDKIIDFTIDNAITDGEDFGIGNVIVAKLTLGLLTDTSIETNATIKIYMQLTGKDGPTEWVQLGRYRIDSRKTQGKIWRFNCFDELIKGEQPYTSNLNYPTTSKQIFLELLFKLDYDFDEEELDELPEFLITYKLEDYLYSCREILGYLAQIYSGNFVMDNEGKLKLIGVTDTSSKLTVETSEYSSLNELNEQKVITRIVANIKGEREQMSIGDGTVYNTLFLQNPIITEEILCHIFEQIQGYTFTPLEIQNWSGFPYIECGDFITFRKRDNTSVRTVVQISSLSYKGGLLGKITSPVKSYSQSEYELVGSTNQMISSIKSRIGVYVLRENTSAIIINNRYQAKMMLPLSSLSTTDLMFSFLLIGQATNDTELSMEIRGQEGLMGKVVKTRIWKGINTVSISFLIRGVPSLQDNLLLYIKTEIGTFIVEKEQAQFYVYGANLVGDSGIPYAAIEDTIEYENYIIDDNIVIEVQAPIKANIFDIIGFQSYINSDSVTIEIV